MSTSADDRDPHTPFDARLDATSGDATAGDAISGADESTSDETASRSATRRLPLMDAATAAHARGAAQARWESFRRDKVMPVLRRERQLSHAMQLALAAVGGALLVVVTSTVIGVALPHPDQPTVANNQHPLVTVEDLTAKALKEKGVEGVQSNDANSVDAEGNTATTPNTSVTDENSTVADGDRSDTSADVENASQEADSGDSSAPGTLAALSSDPKRERKRARRQQDRILDEQRELEDRKRAIERQIEDKGLEERRRQEDQALTESRMTDDQRRRNERHSEDERLRAEDEQRGQSQNNDPKLAQIP